MKLKLRTDIEGVKIIPVRSSSLKNNREFEKTLCDLVRGLETLENNVIVTSNDDESLSYQNMLSKNDIRSVIIDDSQAYFDYLLDKGVRICTFLRLGCLTFENVIIPNTYTKLFNPDYKDMFKIPVRYWFFDEHETFLYRRMLFFHSIASSRKTTYLFNPQDDENYVQVLVNQLNYSIIE